jgi:hypothetical protein
MVGEPSLSARRQPEYGLYYDGTVPGAPHDQAVLLRTRVLGLVSEFIRRNRPEPFTVNVRYGSGPGLPSGPPGPLAEPAAPSDPAPAADRDEPKFRGIEPGYRLDQLVLPPATRDRLLDCAAFVALAPLVFGTWGLRAIEPHPSIAVNFRGPPGTGKTMAAHAVAAHLGKKIMLSRLSDLESKYHGQGPKNLVDLFESAARADAVLFIDEAESLLSRRFAQPDQAAESAINSMRTELLMALDAFDGLVIFASNLPHSYDVAIESRLFHVDFQLPDLAARHAIWANHLPPSLPRAPDVSVDELAAVDGVSGRDIKLAVIAAAVGTARRNLPAVPQQLLLAAVQTQRTENAPAPVPAGGPPADGVTADRIRAAVAATGEVSR